jgi:hypothetical protein
MPQTKIQFRPGINTMATPTLNEGGWSDGNLIRFRQGLPEKWGGWVKYLNTALTGICRSLLAFTTLAGEKMTAAGTNNHCYLIKGGQLYDLTPVDRTIALSSGRIATTSGSATVTITTAASHGVSAGDYVTLDAISGQTRTASGITLNGITLSGDYVVVTTASATVLTFTAANVASGTGTYGSSSTLTCYLPAGPVDNTAGLGWGAAGWGVTAWGSPASVGATLIPARIWSLEAWGQSLLAAPAQGALFAWSPDTNGNVVTRLAAVTNGTTAYGPPYRVGSIVVGMPERHVLALGASDLGSTANYDPMLVRWCTVEDYTTWNATSTNSAGSFRLQGGSQIVGAWNTTLQTLIWTDSALHICRFLGGTYIYGFTMAGQNCGMIGQRAYAELNGVVYWMSGKAFWRFAGGAPERIPCTIEETVFNALSQAQQTKTTAGVNTLTGEIIWFYPASGSECSAYVTYSPGEGVWTSGTLARTAWLGADLLQSPLAASPSGYLYSHENGTDADGAALGDYIVSGYADMGDGEQIQMLTQVAPDFNNQVGNLQITFYIKDWPNGTTRTKGPFLMTPTTTTRGFRARGRQVAIRIESMGTGSTWRMGALRVNTQPDGLR